MIKAGYNRNLLNLLALLESGTHMGSNGRQTGPNLIEHGRMTCDRCWQNTANNIQESGPFRLVRDPGHWGSSNPSTMVLGISKGNTQSNAYATDPFDSVGFKGIRHRLLEVLQSVGLLENQSVADFERRFQKDEHEYAFASVVRCSLTGMDRKKRAHTVDSANVIPAFKIGSAGYRFSSACVEQHIGRLPDATRRVVLLGNTDAYIRHLRRLVDRSRGGVQGVNSVAYNAGNVLFVHVAHPSKGNGHFGAFVRGEGTPGDKMRMAREALISA